MSPPMQKAPVSLDAVIKVAFCLDGRDKITKFLQYGGRAAAWYLLSIDPKSELGQRMTALYRSMQQGRKAFRVGKSLTSYKKLIALPSDKTKEQWKKYLLFIQHAGMVGYYMYDNMGFLGKNKIVSFDTETAAGRGGALGFFAVLASLALSTDDIRANLEKERCVRDVLASEQDESRIQSLREQLDNLRDDRFNKALNYIKTFCDLVVASNSPLIRLSERLTGSKLNDGVMGSVGCLSAAIMLYNTWPSVPVPQLPAPSDETSKSKE